MLSLSKKTDYALIALSYLAEKGLEHPTNTKEIAERYAIPVELLAKIMQRLAKEQVLFSTSGPNGGYRLARAAHEISIADVIEIIDGTPAIAHCLKAGDNQCDQWENCSIRSPLQRVNDRILQLLKRISLAEIASTDLMTRRRQPETIPLTTLHTNTA